MENESGLIGLVQRFIRAREDRDFLDQSAYIKVNGKDVLPEEKRKAASQMAHLTRMIKSALDKLTGSPPSY